MKTVQSILLIVSAAICISCQSKKEGSAAEVSGTETSQQEETETPRQETEVSAVVAESTEEDTTDAPVPQRVLVKETTAQDGVITREYTEDDGYSSIFERIYPNMNMQQAYKRVRSIEKQLRKELPTSNMEYEVKADSTGLLNVTYAYEAKDHLKIELFYQGGTTYIEMLRQGKDVKVTETYCAD